MSGFVEIAPSRRSRGTGVRVSSGDRSGVTVVVWSEALAALGGGDACPVKVYLDADPAMPRLRIERYERGPFKVAETPRRGASRMVRVGRVAGLQALPDGPASCTWESVEGRDAIDVDLPRALLAGRTMQAATARTGLMGDTVRSAGVTLPRVSMGERHSAGEASRKR